MLRDSFGGFCSKGELRWPACLLMNTQRAKIMISEYKAVWSQSIDFQRVKDAYKFSWLCTKLSVEANCFAL